MVLFIGIPGTGKSRFFRDHFYESHVRINMDMLRTRHREEVLLNACFEAKQKFVVDNTNVSKEERARYISAAKAAGFRIVGYYFSSRVAEAFPGMLAERARAASLTKLFSEWQDGWRFLIERKASTISGSCAYVRTRAFSLRSGKMKFDDLDKKLRAFETAHDTLVLPEMFMVARIDGRGFTRLTKEIHKFESPYDERFRDHMIATTEHLMNCGFRVIYGYTQSDEISLLLHRDESLFDRKLRKLTSVLAGEASARFTLSLGAMASFDCRICEFPNERLVVDYFRWRNEDALRNALNAHCYWMLRKKGASVKEATAALSGLPVSQKHELLFANGINFAKLPAWQRRGVGLLWEPFEKEGRNPKTGAAVKSTRRRIKVDLELPVKEAYTELLRRLVSEAGT